MDAALLVASSPLEQLRLPALHAALTAHGVPCEIKDQTGDDLASVLTCHPRAQVVAVAGNDATALAFVQTAAARGLRIVRIDAGARTFHDDRIARALDQVAAIWLCATTQQRDNLRRERHDVRRAFVVGSTLAQALATSVPSNSATASMVALWLDDAPKELRSALEAEAHRHALTVQNVTDFDTLATARVVVTDSALVQEAACALRIPCVTTATSTAHPETVDCGANQVAGPDARAAARALAMALTESRDWQSPWPPLLGSPMTAAARALAEQDADSESSPPLQLELPSDGDFTGRTLGSEECEIVARALRSGTLNSTRGTFVPRFEQAFAQAVGRRHAVACASGSAAMHGAIAALGLAPGDEVVTTPITDMGALTCISYEGGVPVFADVDPQTLNVTSQTIAAQLTDRTRAVVATHLFGRACDMGPIMELCRSRGLPLIEDMAQALGSAERSGRPGTFGSIACYSLQQGKHMTTGEGGIVVTDDAQHARRLFLFVNKAWGYGDPQPDHYFPAPNYRMTELQGAVALAQLRKLDWVVQARRRVAAAITNGLVDVAGLELPKDPPGGRHSYWKYAFFVDPLVIRGGASELARRMKQRGVSCVPHYIQKPAFECALYRDFNASPVTKMPLEHSPRRHQAQPLFVRADYPGTVRALDRVVVLPINECYEEHHTTAVCAVIREEAARLLHG